MTGDEYFELLEHFVLHSPDSSVRAHCLAQIAANYRGTEDPKVSSLLAKIVRNESESRDRRLIAYFVLFEVVGRPLTEIPLPNGLPLLDDLDWAFVDSYA
jgi:hypothetical protein